LSTLQRLIKPKQFQAAMAKSPVLHTAHFALHAAPAAGVQGLADEPAIGVVLPKRWAKRAVTRNGMRRQVYAQFGQSAAQLPRAAFVVRLKRSYSRDDFISAWSKPLAAAVRLELVQLTALCAASSFKLAGLAEPVREQA
jgi:ribonuclease P protein component